MVKWYKSNFWEKNNFLWVLDWPNRASDIQFYYLNWFDMPLAWEFCTPNNQKRYLGKIFTWLYRVFPTNERWTVCSFVRSSFVFAILSPKNQYLNEKNKKNLQVQRTERLSTNATQRKWFNYDSFEWATTAMIILNFFPRKSTKKTKIFLNFFDQTL